MKYSEFNKRILFFFRDRSHSTFCSFSIDKNELEQIVSIDAIKTFPELKEDWGDLLVEKNCIPQYFGLLAIQCLAASQMHDDGTHTAEAYSIRLLELLGLQKTELYQLFNSSRGLIEPAQEKIWYSAKSYFKRNFNQELVIPQKTTGAGRFVQYPKSQTLLNLEDLRRFTPFFQQEFTVKEKISFTYFHQRLEAGWLNIRKTKRSEKIFQDKSKYLSCVKQLFNFFNDWNGDIYSFASPNSAVQQKKTYRQSNLDSHILILIADGQKVHLYVKRDNGRAKQINLEEAFSSEHKYCFHKGILLFSESEYGINEFIGVRLLNARLSSWILLENDIRYKEAQLLDDFSEKISVTENISLYKCPPGDLLIKKWFASFFQDPCPILLEGGVRLNRKRHYLQGFGPEINSEYSFKVLFQNEVYEYNSGTAPPGLYKVRSDYYADVEFSILLSKKCEENISPFDIGWDLSNYEFVYNGRWTGCYLRSNEMEKMMDIRRYWIDVNVGRPYNGIHPLLKTIVKFKKK